MNQRKPIVIRRSPRVDRNAILRKRLRFRVMNLAISGCILLIAHGAGLTFLSCYLFVALPAQRDGERSL